MASRHVTYAVTFKNLTFGNEKIPVIDQRELKRLRSFYNRQKSNIKAIRLTVSRIADYQSSICWMGYFNSKVFSELVSLAVSSVAILSVIK